MTYDKSNTLITFNGNKVSYDSNGNMISGPLDGKIVSYKYDCRNRLIGIGNTSYTHDAENNRTAVTEKVTDYVYWIGLISEQDSKNNYKLYHYDRRGSTTALTNGSGAVTDRYSYETYGKLVNHQGDTIT